jgi:hypothetical protein
MTTQFVAVGDTKVRIPTGDYGERLYRPDDPPEDFKVRFAFDVPSDVRVDHARRFVLGYMLDPSDGADMRYEVRLNGVQVASGHPVGGVARGTWEIVGSDLLRDAPEHNNVDFWALPDLHSRGYLQFSDVVIWFNAR